MGRYLCLLVDNKMVPVSNEWSVVGVKELLVGILVAEMRSDSPFRSNRPIKINEQHTTNTKYAKYMYLSMTI